MWHAAIDTDTLHFRMCNEPFSNCRYAKAHNEMEPFPFRFHSLRYDPIRSASIIGYQKAAIVAPKSCTLHICMTLLLITNIGDWVARQQCVHNIEHRNNGVRKFLRVCGSGFLDRVGDLLGSELNWGADGFRNICHI